MLRVHSSNFRIVGFTEETPLAKMASIAREHGVLLLDDMGSGCLLETREYGLTHEPTPQESIAAGADLVMFSGDKLLGGPQAGIIVGREAAVAPLRSHPLMRALRPDKTTIGRAGRDAWALPARGGGGGNSGLADDRGGSG